MPSRSRPRQRRSKSGKKKSRSVKRQSVKRQSVKRRSARRQQLMPQDVMRGRRLRGGATKDELSLLVADLKKQKNKSADLEKLLAQATTLLEEIGDKEPSSEQQARLDSLEGSLGSHLLPEESQPSLGTNDPVIVPQATKHGAESAPPMPENIPLATQEAVAKTGLSYNQLITAGLVGLGLGVGGTLGAQKLKKGKHHKPHGHVDA